MISKPLPDVVANGSRRHWVRAEAESCFMLTFGVGLAMDGWISSDSGPADTVRKPGESVDGTNELGRIGYHVGTNIKATPHQFINKCK